MLGEEYKTLQLDEAIMKKESPHGAVTQATGGREGSTKRTAQSQIEIGSGSSEADELAAEVRQTYLGTQIGAGVGA